MSITLTPSDHEARALWHLELLGCYAPEDAITPYEPAPPRQPDYDDDDGYIDGAYLGDAVTCWRCGGEGIDVTCMDDICRWLGYCMHGDGQQVCRECGGEGRL